MPPIVGSVVNVTTGGNPDEAMWEFSAECVLSEADTGPLMIDASGMGLQSPTDFIDLTGQVLTLRYPNNVDAGNAWAVDTQPAAVDVPGGTFALPEGGAVS